MAIKFQYNKTSLQQLEKNLKMRQRTLPIIKNKETALRLEVKKSKQEAEDLEQKLQQQIGGYESMYALWGEFDASLVSLKDVQLDVKKVAGVRVPVLLNIELDVKPFGLLTSSSLKYFLKSDHVTSSISVVSRLTSIARSLLA